MGENRSKMGQEIFAHIVESRIKKSVQRPV